ncbi:hypothetical protein JVT61DRAFT_4356 [Boletus reticuloceps]|uniref:Uncharacterized protein n=1 Tax=Boletus reticuloceps TaxID=495285 RepID=A0A8I2YKY0_9AGAM|nr:hypothetical protein JVT61DRAFT_4356 [Boletus reticuloceps]
MVRGWPTTIGFAKVPARVKRTKKELEAMDRDDTSDTKSLDTGHRPRGPRSESAFSGERSRKRQRNKAAVPSSASKANSQALKRHSRE